MLTKEQRKEVDRRIDDVVNAFRDVTRSRSSAETLDALELLGNASGELRHYLDTITEP